MESQTSATPQTRTTSHPKAASSHAPEPQVASREIPASCPSFKSFAHIRNPKVRRAKEYEQHLLLMRDMFPEYAAGIDEQLTYARSQQERGSVSDRDRVLAQLETCALSCIEVADDLSMPYATAYKILQEFAAAGLVVIRERPGRSGNKPVCYYSLR